MARKNTFASTAHLFEMPKSRLDTPSQALLIFAFATLSPSFPFLATTSSQACSDFGVCASSTAAAAAAAVAVAVVAVLLLLLLQHHKMWCQKRV